MCTLLPIEVRWVLNESSSLAANQEETGSRNVPPFWLLTVEVEEAMWPTWPSVRPIYTKSGLSPWQRSGVRLNPLHPHPAVCLCTVSPQSVPLSLRFHFLSPLQLYHPSVIRHSNKAKHTNASAKTTQLSIFKCYRIKNNFKILILCMSDPVPINWCLSSLEFGNFFFLKV